jgi:hypothetical protein
LVEILAKGTLFSRRRRADNLLDDIACGECDHERNASGGDTDVGQWSSATNHIHHVIQHTGPAKSALVLLHGSGGNEHDLVALAGDWQLRALTCEEDKG